MNGLQKSRTTVEISKDTSVKRDCTCNFSQINFDGKLLPSLGGFGKVNRLAVVLVQDEENKILAITK